MKKKSKKHLIYKLVSLTTIIAPTLIFLLFHALYYSIPYDIRFYGLVDSQDLKIGMNEEYTYVYTEIEYAEIDGIVSLHNGYIVSYLHETTTIRINNNFYNYNFETNEFVNINALELQKQQETKIPLWIIVSAVALGIGFLIIKGNMKRAMETPRLSAFVGLAIMTAITYFISLIATNMFNVFFVLTISWGIYCVEYIIYTKSNEEQVSQNKNNMLLNAMSEALKNFK